MPSVAIIGAGAAGCFCAAQLRKRSPELAVTVFEAGAKPLAKVAITGGGRCNLTNSFEGIRSLSEAYPRGERVVKRALQAFSQEDTIRWFTGHGVPCVLQPDHCWFPRSQDAMDIVRCLLSAMQGAHIRLRTPETSVTPADTGNLLVNEEPFDYVVVTTGGASHFPYLDGLQLGIVPPVPSLFTFTIPDPALRSLMGLVVEASIGLAGTSFKASGPLLVTDWGLSGPATLKLSSYAARHLADTGYKGTVCINWLDKSQTQVRELLQETASENPQAELGSKGLNRLIATLTSDSYPLSGKSKFREEFVTAGGVALSNINPNTLECKQHPGLYFAGEVLDIDAITGGFNLQAAWSTGYVCAESIISSL